MCCPAQLSSFIYNQVGWRNTEPKSLRSWRIFFYYLFSFCLFFYFIVLIVDHLNDIAVIQTRIIYQAKIPPPTLTFDFPYNFSLRCNFNFSANIANNTPTGSDWLCENYLSQPVLDTTSVPPLFVGSFSAKNGGGAKFSDSGLEMTEIFIDLANQSQSLANNPRLKLTMVDAESKMGVVKGDTNYALLTEIKKANLYVLGPHMENYVTFKRYHNISIAPGFRNLLGVPPSEHTDDYGLKSLFQSVLPSSNDTSPTSYAYLQVRLQSHGVEELKQKNLHNILASISAFGGAYSLGIIIYIFCFGDKPIRPWGLMQHIPCIKKRLRDQIFLVYGTKRPLVQRTSLNYYDGCDPAYDSRFKILEQRCHVLEEILMEHVFDHRFLAEFKGRKGPQDESFNKS